MKRVEKRILTTHVGSRIRPKSLLDAHKAGLQSASYQQELKAAVADVVAKQVKAGLPSESALMTPLRRGSSAIVVSPFEAFRIGPDFPRCARVRQPAKPSESRDRRSRAEENAGRSALSRSEATPRHAGADPRPESCPMSPRCRPSVARMSPHVA